jgi:predicted dinucleotide-binding enzyme
MKYAIIGFGRIGQAIATAFARKSMEVTVAATRSALELAQIAQPIGPSVLPGTITDALKADIIFLAVPFAKHRKLAGAADWNGKILVDVTNAYGVPLAHLDGRPSSSFVASIYPGASVVKGFNHLAARVLAQDPLINGGRRVVFLAGDNAAAVTRVAELAELLNFAPVNLGGLSEGGRLVQAKGDEWAPLIFQDLVKFDGAGAV